LKDNTIYYWQVEAIDQAGAVTVADGKTSVFFTNIINESPNPVILISPKNNEYVFTQYPAFEWLMADDPDPNDQLIYYLRYWPVGAIVRYVYGTDTTYCDIRRLKYDYEYYWCVEVEDSEGLTAISDTFLLKTSSTGIDNDAQLPEEFALYQNYPNPFNPATTIRFDLPETADIRLAIYDVNGRQVRILVDEKRKAGVYSAIWDGKDGSGRPVSAGVYIFTLKCQDVILSKKMIFLK